MDWPDITDDSQRPKWLRQKPFKPCPCKQCFFCVNHLTGPHGPPVSTASSATAAAPVTASAPRKRARSTPSTASTRSGARSRTPARRTPRSAAPATTRVRRGVVQVVVRDHIAGKAERLFATCRDCGVCKAEGRKRIPKGVKRDDSNKHLYINTCKTGCPHLNCRDHPVCKEHWPTYQHK